MSGLRRELNLLLLALQFLTRVPIPARLGHGPPDTGAHARAVRHFPLVGALIGASTAVLAVLALQRWSAPVAAVLATGFSVWLTAALHEDGLADTCDALLGMASREKALRVMKDARIGTWGASGLGFVLLLRILLLAELLAYDPRAAVAALIAAHAAARAVPVVLMRTLPYAGDEAQARTRALTRDGQWRDVIFAVAVGTAILLGAAAWQSAPLPAGSTALALLVLLTAALHLWLQHRLGGQTGDTLGAAEQLGEVLVLLAFVARWPLLT